MLIHEILRTALRSLGAQRVRTGLAMLGIAIGVGSLVAVVSLGEGARAEVERAVLAAGGNLWSISPQRMLGGRAVSPTLRAEDADALAGLAHVEHVAPELARSGRVKFFERHVETLIVGTQAEYPAVRGFRIARGRFIGPGDMLAKRRVVVLGADTADSLFGPLDPLDRRIRVSGVVFTVVGVLGRKGATTWFNPDDQVVVPLSTLQRVLFGSDHVTGIGLTVDPDADAGALRHVLARVLRMQHRLRPDEADDFRIRSQDEIIELQTQLADTLTALLGSVAAISLLVGGIGIMNVMLVSVRERVGEIGVRRAVGARRRDILRQFLVEALLVSLSGGAAGLAAGIAGGALLARLGPFDAAVPASTVLLALCISIAVGLVFGVWPARKASLLHPVEAFRYE